MTLNRSSGLPEQFFQAMAALDDIQNRLESRVESLRLQAEESAAERAEQEREFAEQARSGALGANLQEVQERIDARITTRAAVFEGTDDSPATEQLQVTLSRAYANLRSLMDGETLDEEGEGEATSAEGDGEATSAEGDGEDGADESAADTDGQTGRRPGRLSDEARRQAEDGWAEARKSRDAALAAKAEVEAKIVALGGTLTPESRSD